MTIYFFCVLYCGAPAGSNRHNNNAPGGDGQTGDAGEGTGGETLHILFVTIKICRKYHLTSNFIFFPLPNHFHDFILDSSLDI